MGATADLEASQWKGSLKRQPRFDDPEPASVFLIHLEPCSFQLREVDFPEKKRFQKKGLVDVHPGHAVPAL